MDRLLKAKFVIAPDVKALLHTHADWGRIPPEKWFDPGSPATFWSRRTATTAGPAVRPLGTALGLAANPGLLASP
ncbi:MAG: hypothetical protein ACLSTO_02310 [Bilophila wadsworthia]